MGWNATNQRYPTRDVRILNDILRTRSWGLLHQPGAITYPHHDASGQLTWVRNMCGYKFWVVCRVKPQLLGGHTVDQVLGLMSKALDPDTFLAKRALKLKRCPPKYDKPLPWEELVDGELVVLGPGDEL